MNYELRRHIFAICTAFDVCRCFNSTAMSFTLFLTCTSEADCTEYVELLMHYDRPISLRVYSAMHWVVI